MTPDQPLQERTPERWIGGYRVRRSLGRGGMAEVLEVEHPETGEVMALKLMHSDAESDEAVRRFNAEFRALKQLDHPKILRVFDSGLHEGRPWFVMERLRGQDLRAEIETWRALPPSERAERAERVLIDVASALTCIHDKGLVHRDITPGNIRVLEDGSARLMDFGVVHTPGLELTVVGEMVGTVAYIAPEQISQEINQGRVDARADLYSLGCVLYHMLTGRKPFQAPTLPGLLEKHLSAEPRPPEELVPGLSPLLNAVCLRLMRKQPDERFGSARHLLAVLRPRHRDRVDLRRWPVHLVGRTGETAKLRAALSNLVTTRRGGVILLEGPSGSGKTRLIDELLRGAQDLQVPSASGVCAQEHGAYSGFRAVLQGLSALGQALPPALEQVFHPGERELEPYPVMSALRELLSSLAPIVVAVDELHFADRGTLKLLEFLVRNHLSLGNDAILFVLARRPPEGLDPLDLAAGERIQRLSLPPLSQSAVEELLLQLVVDSPAAAPLAARLHQEGEGNAALIGDMMRGLIDNGTLLEEGGCYTVDLAESEVSRLSLPVPSTLQASLRLRLRALSSTALRLAQLVALSQQESSLDVLSEALALSEDRLQSALDELIDAGVVRARSLGMSELFDLAQARMRDVLLADLADEDRAALHRRLGVALERVFRRRAAAVVETLAWHFEQGDLAAKAYPYLTRAGVRVRDRGLVAEAMDFFDRALLLEPRAREFLVLDEADRQLADLRLQRGQALFHLGRWAEAEEDWRIADQLALDIDDERLRTRTLFHLARKALNDERVDEAEELLSNASQIANRLGDPALRADPLYGLGSARWYRGDLDGARHCWLESLTLAGTARLDEAMGNAYNGLGLVAFCRGQAAEARKYLEQSSQIYERLGKIPVLSVSRVNLAELCECTGSLRKGLQLMDRTIVQCREVDHPYGVALALRYRAMLLVNLGRLTEARDNAEQAQLLSDRIHSPVDEVSMLTALIRVGLAQGDLDRVQGLLEKAASLVGRFDVEGYQPLIYAWWAWWHAARGEAEEVLEKLERSARAPGRSWPHQQCRVDLVAARALTLVGRKAEALIRAEEALRQADTCGYRLYSMKAHLRIAAAADDSDRINTHLRIARNLARSLGANLSREDGEGLLMACGIPNTPAVP